MSWTYAEYEADIRRVAKAFIKLGLRPHHSVAIMGHNAPKWHLSNVAAVVAGGIATGVYPTNSSEAVNYVLEHSRADILVVGDSENLAKLSDTGTKLAAADKYALQGSLIETLVEAQPTRFIGVPRVYEKIADKLQEVAAKGGRSPTTCTLCTTTIAHLLQVVKDNDQLAEKERTLYLNIF